MAEIKINYEQKLIILLHRISGVPALDIKRDLAILEDSAYKDPKLYREVRHDILSGAYVLKDAACDHPLYVMEEKYGRRSILFGSYCKVVSIVRLNMRAVIRKQKEGNIPPAFDPLLRADTQPTTADYDAIIQDAPICIGRIRDGLRRWKSMMTKGRVILLNNGSTMHHEWHGIKITDVMSNIITYPIKEKKPMKFPNLNKLVKVMNNREDNDPFVYIAITNFYTDYAGIHTMIPDKDGKIREIYSFNSDIQILSKGIHELFDSIARTLPGNYTYNHRSWIYNLISENWNKNKIIITTDMSKYSDTLDRAFILRILEKAGMSEDEIKELDILYSCPVMEKQTREIFTGTLASYQGQYGDFPLITIANLVMQECVYNRMNHDMKPGYNAAVGDDTGFIFDLTDRSGFEIDPDKAYDTICNVYRTVGVNINKLKTGRLVKGKGACDFVKVNFDGEGILPYLEVRSYYKGNSDQIIRDIFDNPGLTTEEKHNYLSTIFNKDIANYLLSLHKINGGLRTDRITVEDVVQLIDNTWSILREINTETHSDLVRFLEAARKELNNTLHPTENVPCGLRHTALFRFRDIGPQREDGHVYTGEEIDDNIMMNVLSIGTIGMSEDHDYLNLVGFTWADIEYGCLCIQEGNNLQDPRVSAYRTINDFFMLTGRYKEKRKGKGSNVYLRHYTDNAEDKTETSHILLNGMEKIQYRFDSLDDFKQNVNIAINGTNQEIRDTFLKKRLTDTTLTRSKVRWIKGRFPVLEHDGTIYRLYDVLRTSKYPLIDRKIMALYPDIFERFDYDMNEVKRCYRYH